MSSNPSKSASQFAPYVIIILLTKYVISITNPLQTPPPDDPSYAPVLASTSRLPTRPWFPNHTSSQNIDTSYQSGGMPTFNTSATGGAGAAEEAEGQTSQWETRYGMRVDVLAAVAYLLGPISGARYAGRPT